MRKYMTVSALRAFPVDEAKYFDKKQKRKAYVHSVSSA